MSLSLAMCRMRTSQCLFLNQLKEFNVTVIKPPNASLALFVKNKPLYTQRKMDYARYLLVVYVILRKSKIIAAKGLHAGKVNVALFLEKTVAVSLVICLAQKTEFVHQPVYLMRRNAFYPLNNLALQTFLVMTMLTVTPNARTATTHA